MQRIAKASGCSRLRSCRADLIKRETMKVTYKIFRGTLATWDTLFDRATEFATCLGRDALINISHSASGADGVVTVWYWTDKDLG